MVLSSMCYSLRRNIDQNPCGRSSHLNPGTIEHLMQDARAAPAARPPRPLGLPPGSVRAAVALTIIGVFSLITLRGMHAGLLLSEAMLIVLAHYFASRQLVTVPKELRAQLQRDGLVQEEPNPLWLPRNSVRILILIAILGTTGVLLTRGQLFQGGVFDNLILVLSYLVGVMVQFVRQRRGPRTPSRWGRVWIHLKALLVLAACALILLFGLTGTLADLPDWVEQLLLGWVLFYFGSR